MRANAVLSLARPLLDLLVSCIFRVIGRTSVAHVLPVLFWARQVAPAKPSGWDHALPPCCLGNVIL